MKETYRMMLFFDAVDREAATDICDQIAELCSNIIGRPATHDSQIPFILAAGPDESESFDHDQEKLMHWFQTNIQDQGFTIVIIPAPIGEVLH